MSSPRLQVMIYPYGVWVSGFPPGPVHGRFALNTTIREIDVHALYQLLDSRDRVQILDVRPAEAFQAGHVEGRRAAHLVNVPYAAFTADEAGAVGSLPFDREQELVVVCARGRTSRLATELLQRHGFRVSSMTGGMQAWGDFYVMHEVVPSTPDLTICLLYTSPSPRDS